jgi:hypothetical protein
MFGKKAANKLFARFLYELERPKAWISIYDSGTLEVTLEINGGNCPVNSGSCFYTIWVAIVATRCHQATTLSHQIADESTLARRLFRVAYEGVHVLVP